MEKVQLSRANFGVVSAVSTGQSLPTSYCAGRQSRIAALAAFGSPA